MQTVRLASFVVGADLYLVVASPFRVGGPLHLRGPIFATSLQDNMEHTLWLELLHPFTGVKDLYLSAEFSPSIAPALQELAGGRTTEVLPALKNIFLERLQPPGPEGIVKFVAARQLSGHPITVSLWNR